MNINEGKTMPIISIRSLAYIETRNGHGNTHEHRRGRSSDRKRQSSPHSPSPEELRASEIRHILQNINDGISLLQFADFGLYEIEECLSQMREHAVECVDPFSNLRRRHHCDKEFHGLIEKIQEICNSTMYLEHSLLDGSMDHLTFQVGTSRGRSDLIEIQLHSIAATPRTLGIVGVRQRRLSLTSPYEARNAIESLDAALAQIRSHKQRIASYGQKLQESLAFLVAQEQLGHSSILLDSTDAQLSAGLIRQQLVEVGDPSELTDAADLQSIPYELLCS
jgi:hypothetical protein